MQRFHGPVTPHSHNPKARILVAAKWPQVPENYLQTGDIKLQGFTAVIRMRKHSRFIFPTFKFEQYFFYFCNIHSDLPRAAMTSVVLLSGILKYGDTMSTYKTAA